MEITQIDFITPDKYINNMFNNYKVAGNLQK